MTGIPDALANGLMLMAEATGKVLTPERVAVIARALERYKDHDILEAFDLLANREDHFPSLGKIKRAIREVKVGQRKAIVDGSDEARRVSDVQAERVYDVFEEQNPGCRPTPREIADLARDLGFHELMARSKLEAAASEAEHEQRADDPTWLAMVEMAREGVSFQELMDFCVREKGITLFRPSMARAPNTPAPTDWTPF